MMLAGMRAPFELALLRGVSERHAIATHDIRDVSVRRREVVRARREWVVGVYGSCGCVAETGRRVGMDHTSVIHSLRREGLLGPLGMPRKAVAR
jgi:hypothetical protein